MYTYRYYVWPEDDAVMSKNVAIELFGCNNTAGIKDATCFAIAGHNNVLNVLMCCCPTNYKATLKIISDTRNLKDSQ